MNLAVGKLPPLNPGEFRFTTKALVAEAAPSDDGKRRFKTIASSTIRDLRGDEMKYSALEDMADAFRRGLTIFMNHKYDAPDSAFGMSDQAQIMDSGLRDPKTGAPIYDLHIGGFVDESNPKAIQLHDSMLGGMRWGTSIGAIVKGHQKNKSGGLDIEHVDCKEGSIVGIPMNQRSWVQKAANAVANLEDAVAVGLLDDEDDDDESTVTAGVPTVVGEAGPETVAVLNGTSTTVSSTTTYPVADTVATWPLDVQASTNVLTIKADACPTCGKGRGEDGDCEDDYHSAQKGVEEPVAETAADATTDVTDEGQEAEVATPETAQEAEGATPEPDTTIPVGVTAGYDPDDVERLAAHVRTLAEAVDEQDKTIARLTDELTAVKGERDELASENREAKEVIEKIMRQPLRPKTTGHVAGLSHRYPDFLAPEVVDFLRKTGEPS